MKKTIAILLACVLVFSALSAGADTVTEGFDPTEVAKGMQTKVNSHIKGRITVLAADTLGLYTVFLEESDMGCYLNVDHVDGQGKSCEGEFRNHIAFTEVFTYSADTANNFLSFWLVCSAGLLEAVSGEEYSKLTDDVFAALNEASNAEDHIARIAVGPYDVTVDIMSGSGMVLLGLEITVRDLV